MHSSSVPAAAVQPTEWHDSIAAIYNALHALDVAAEQFHADADAVGIPRVPMSQGELLHDALDCGSTVCSMSIAGTEAETAWTLLPTVCGPFIALDANAEPQDGDQLVSSALAAGGDGSAGFSWLLRPAERPSSSTCAASNVGTDGGADGGSVDAVGAERLGVSDIAEHAPDPPVVSDGEEP